MACNSETKGKIFFLEGKFFFYFFYTGQRSFWHAPELSSPTGSTLGATSIVKIGEVRLSGEIGGGVKFRKKTNFIITIRYEIPTFSLVGPFFEEGEGSKRL